VLAIEQPACRPVTSDSPDLPSGMMFSKRAQLIGQRRRGIDVVQLDPLHPKAAQGLFAGRSGLSRQVHRPETEPAHAQVPR
jgi:hypothetical protein